mgnify:CR=1 FL=1
MNAAQPGQPVPFAGLGAIGGLDTGDAMDALQALWQHRDDIIRVATRLPELLGEAIRAADQGDSLISPSITRRLLSTFAGMSRAAPPTQPLDPLTEREEQVLLTIAQGRTNAEIAADLHISLSTVKTHVASLMAKLGARNRVEVAMWAYETGRVREQ